MVKKILLIVWPTFFVGLFLGIFLHMDKTSKNNKAVINELKSTVVQPNESSESRLFHEIAKYSKKSDYDKTKILALSFAQDVNQITTMRLDSYRICIQASISTNDKKTQATCYEEALKLVESSDDEEFRNNWVEYLNQVNNNIDTQEQINDPQR